MTVGYLMPKRPWYDSDFAWGCYAGFVIGAIFVVGAAYVWSFYL